MPSEASLEQQLLEFLYACPVGLIECDRAGAIGMINPLAMQHLLSLGRIGQTANLFEALEQHAPEVRNLADGFLPDTGRVYDNHRIFVDLGSSKREGEPKVLACTMVKLGPDRFMVTLADVSVQVAQERRLRQADTWFASLLDDINDYAVLTVTPDGIIDSTNASFTRQTGHACRDVVHCALSSILTDTVGSSGFGLVDQLRIAGRDGWFLDEGWQQRKNGERYWCQRLVVARMEHEGTTLAGFSIVLRDVPRRDVAASELRRLLTCDHLTGAANRMEFRRVLERACMRWCDNGHPLALVMLDLDHFKSVNDRHGHPMGDAVLRAVATACADVLRPGDLFARLGGEEFAGLLPGATPDEARAIAERLRETVADLVVGGEASVQVTASLGIASLAEAAGSIDTLILLADQRLYAAKRGGRDRVHGTDANVPA